MTAATPVVATPVVARRAVLVGTKEVTFTPYVIRKVGEVRQCVIDGEIQSVIYNAHRGLTYLVLNGVTGRIAAELVADCSYETCTKSRKVAPVAAKVETVAPVAAKVEVVKTVAPVAAPAKVRRPKTPVAA
jgi:hypothetical protein